MVIQPACAILPRVVMENKYTEKFAILKSIGMILKKWGNKGGNLGELPTAADILVGVI